VSREKNASRIRNDDEKTKAYIADKAPHDLPPPRGAQEETSQAEVNTACCSASTACGVPILLVSSTAAAPQVHRHRLNPREWPPGLLARPPCRTSPRSILPHPAARPHAQPAPPSLHFVGLLWSPIDFGLLLLLVLEFCPFMGRLSFSFFLFSWAVVSS
jgi:hypothetical protein